MPFQCPKRQLPIPTWIAWHAVESHLTLEQANYTLRSQETEIIFCVANEMTGSV